MVVPPSRVSGRTRLWPAAGIIAGNFLSRGQRMSHAGAAYVARWRERTAEVRVGNTVEKKCPPSNTRVWPGDASCRQLVLEVSVLDGHWRLL